MEKLPKCTECKRCNHKGLPSVTRHSVTCRKRRKVYRSKPQVQKWKKSFVGKEFSRLSGALKNLWK